MSLLSYSCTTYVFCSAIFNTMNAQYIPSTDAYTLRYILLWCRFRYLSSSSRIDPFLIRIQHLEWWAFTLQGKYTCLCIQSFISIFSFSGISFFPHSEPNERHILKLVGCKLHPIITINLHYYKDFLKERGVKIIFEFFSHFTNT